MSMKDALEKRTEVSCFFNLFTVVLANSFTTHTTDAVVVVNKKETTFCAFIWLGYLS